MDFYSIWTFTYETLLMTVISTTIAYILGLPVGVLLNITSKKGIKPNRIVNLTLGIIVNVLRSIPCLILIVILMPMTRSIFGVGTGEWYVILLPLVFSAFGFVARMVEQSLNEVPVGEIEAIKSLGANTWQIITKVLIPESKSSLVSGLAVSIVTLLGYTAFAYNIGAGGLISGVYSFYTNHTGNFMSHTIFWVLIIIIIALVQLIQELGLFISKKIDKRRKLK